jgi:hypothetical protein
MQWLSLALPRKPPGFGFHDRPGGKHVMSGHGG